MAVRVLFGVVSSSGGALLEFFAFVGVVGWDGDVRGEFLCAWGKEELMVGAAKDVLGVWVDVDVDDLGVVGASNIDEGV